ncbi:MAG: NAD-binding protein [Candidatus Cloacimonetes bacterium]|nr:NAD-binding protein [Candidatus Cloacimonadota bacterium]
MSNKNQSLYAFLSLIGVSIFGTLGYVLLEDYSFVDAIYMTVITVTTIGFGEIHPLSEYGRLFTLLLVSVGFFSMAWLGRTTIETIFEGVSQGKSGSKKMKMKISKLSKHYILCGFGRVGIAAAEYLESQGVDFVVIDSLVNPDSKNELDQRKYLYINGDATHDSALLDAGIKRARGVLALLNSDPDNLFLVLTARELNPTLQIFSRSEDGHAEHKILKAGADKVITPYKSAGRFIAGSLLNACGTAVKVEKIPEEGLKHKWHTIKEDSKHIGLTVLELEDRFKLEVLGIRRKDVDHLDPQDDMVIEAFDGLMILGSLDKSKVVEDNEPSKVIIVDDNPIVVRLYSRLFQKNGLSPTAASDGIKGAELILSQNPEVAVIDYMLPGMTGINVCRRIKEDPNCNTKLILFTASEDCGARDEALEAGADLVIIKSADTKEIINAVLQLISEIS